MPYISLDNITIASPCTASWDAMSGNDQVRFCGECKKNVFNLSELTRPEAEDLIQKYEGNLCAGYYKRTDGTILTADCPKGFAQLRSSLRKAKLRMMAKVLPTLALLGISIPSFSKQSSQSTKPIEIDTTVKRDTTPYFRFGLTEMTVATDTTRKDSVNTNYYKLGRVYLGNDTTNAPKK